MSKLTGNYDLYGRAKQLRRKMTYEEVKLYSCVFKAEGIHVHRQVPINNYIVDFLVPEKKLVVEVDGTQHDEILEREYDKNRDEVLRSLGYTVLRFKNSQIDNNIDKVADKILQTLASL